MLRFAFVLSLGAMLVSPLNAIAAAPGVPPAPSPTSARPLAAQSIAAPGADLLVGPGVPEYRTLELKAQLTPENWVDGANYSRGSRNLMIAIGNASALPLWRGFDTANSGEFGAQLVGPALFLPTPDRRNFAMIAHLPENATVEYAGLELSANLSNFTITPTREFAWQGDCAIVADLTGDGRNDLVVPDATSLLVYVSSGSGPGTTLPVRVALPAGLAPTTCVSLGDLNADGVAELYVADSYLAAGGRAFVGRSTGPTPSFVWFELDSQGDTALYGLRAVGGLRLFSVQADDFAVASPSYANITGRLLLYSGQDVRGMSTFGGARLAPRRALVGPAGGDFGFGGLANLGSLGNPSASYLGVGTLNATTGRANWTIYETNESSIVTTTAFPGVGGRLGFAGGDIDGDGRDDAVLSVDSGYLLLRGTAAGLNLSNAESLQGTLTLPLGGDYNGDGFRDLVSVGWEGVDVLSIVGRSANNSSIQPIVTLVRPPGAVSVIPVTSGDLTGDGFSDVVLMAYYPDPSPPRLHFFDGRGSDTVVLPRSELDVGRDGTLEFASDLSQYTAVQLDITDPMRVALNATHPGWRETSGLWFKEVPVAIAVLGIGTLRVERLAIRYTVGIEINLTSDANLWIQGANEIDKTVGIPIRVGLSGGSLGFSLGEAWDTAPVFLGLQSSVEVPEEGSLNPPLDVWPLVLDDWDSGAALAFQASCTCQAFAAVSVQEGRYLAVSLSLAGSINWTGTFQVQLAATDRSGLTATGRINVTVVNMNDAPEIRGAPRMFNVTEHQNAHLDLSPYVIDSDNQSSDLVVEVDLVWATATGLVVTFAPGEGAQSTTANIRVSDGLDWVSVLVDVRVQAVNDPAAVRYVGSQPWAGNGSAYTFQVLEHSPLSIQVVASDPEGDLLALAVRTQVPWARWTLNQENLTITLFPFAGNVGFHEFDLALLDAESQVLFTLNFEVLNENDPPICRVLDPPQGSVWSNGSAIPLLASCSDPDEPYGDVVAVVWQLNSGEVLSRSMSGSVRFTGPANITVYLNATDGELFGLYSTNLSILGPTPPTHNGVGDGEPPGAPSDPVAAIAVFGLVATGIIALAALVMRRWRREQ